MSILEWVLLVFFALGFVGGLKFISDGGYDTSRNERLFGICLNMAIVVALTMTAGLTWFGWTLLLLGVYSIGAGIVKYIRHPEGTHTGKKTVAVETALSLTYFVLLLAVGIS
jgi:hypothetical protein